MSPCGRVCWKMCCPLLFKYCMWRSRLHACFLELTIWFWWTSIKGEPWLCYPGVVYHSGTCVYWCVLNKCKCFELNDIDVHMTIYGILSALLWWKMFGWELRWMPSLIFGFKVKFLHIELVFLDLQLKCYSMFAEKNGYIGACWSQWGVIAINGECDGLTLCEWHS